MSVVRAQGRAAPLCGAFLSLGDANTGGLAVVRVIPVAAAGSMTASQLR